MALITDINPDITIWEQNPGLQFITEFKLLRLKEGDERSSNIIKSIFYIWDPKSKVRDSGLTEEQLIADMNLNLIGDENFNWHEYWEFKEFFIEKNISKLEALYMEHEQEIHELKLMLSEWKWGKKDTTQKAAAMKQHKQLLEEAAELKQKISQEAEENVILEGGYTKSLVEGFGTEE